MAEKIRRHAKEPSPPRDVLYFSGMGDLVRALMDKAQLNLKGAQHALGGDFSSWSLWKNDKQPIPTEKLIKLAEAAGMNANEVFAYAMLKVLQDNLPQVSFETKQVRALVSNVLALMEGKQ